MNINPLLSISIPTYNRASFLKAALLQLHKESLSIPGNLIEIIVSDNASPDATTEIVAQEVANGLTVRYIRNSENIGSDANIAQCFNEARGRYVVIMGDDDLFVDGALLNLVQSLQNNDYGMVCLRSYGFDSDFRKELPPSSNSEKSYGNLGIYLTKVAHLVTLISACVINKSLLTGVDANDFCGKNLVQVHLCLLAASSAKYNLFVYRYAIAVKRNNSGGYDHSKVFVTHLLGILDSFVGRGLQVSDVKRIERRLLVTYFPYYLFRLRLVHGNVLEARRNFSNRFGGQWLYTFWTWPALYWPRLPGLAWAAMTTFVGRSYGGDILRGIYFFIQKILRHPIKSPKFVHRLMIYWRR